MATYTPDSYVRSEAALTAVQETVADLIQRRELHVKGIEDVEKGFARAVQGSPAGWAGLVTYVRAQVSENPTDDLWLNLLARVEKTVDDVQAERLKTTQMVNRIEAVGG